MSKLGKYDLVEDMLEEALQDWDSQDSVLDATKFDNGNKAAGRRIRKALQQIKKDCDFIRKAILGKINKKES